MIHTFLSLSVAFAQFNDTQIMKLKAVFYETTLFHFLLYAQRKLNVIFTIKCDCTVLYKFLIKY